MPAALSFSYTEEQRQFFQKPSDNNDYFAVTTT
jgi:hypothetical protein